MATIAELGNLGACGAGTALGTNTKKGCLKKLSAARALWLFQPGAAFASDSTFNLAAVRELQAQGKLIVLQGVNTFEENGDDDNIETLDDTTRERTNKGKYAFSATFTNGLYFNAALKSIEGFGNWNVAIVTADGDVVGATGNSNGLTGFDTGLLVQDKIQWGTTTTGQKEGLSWQFLDRDEVDSEFMIIERGNIDFNPLKVEGINDVTLSYVNTPADSDTSVTVKAVLTSDKKTAVGGATYTDFLRTVDGVTSNPTAGDDSTTEGTYVLTVTAVSTGEVETIRMYDNSENRKVIALDADLYQSNVASATAVA